MIYSPDAIYCEACDLGRRLELRRCAGDGPTEAVVAVVGIAPSDRGPPGLLRGAFEVPRLARVQSAGRAVTSVRISGSARAFAHYVDRVGLDLRKVYSTNLVKCAVPGNALPKRSEVRECVRRYLRSELEGLPNLRAVLLLGKIVGVELLGTGEFDVERRLEGTTATAKLLRHPTSTLRRFSRLDPEAGKVEDFLRRTAPASLTTGFALAPT